MISPPAKNAGPLAWAVAKELSALNTPTAILTPDAKGDTVRKVLAKVHQEKFNRNKRAGTTFGPFPLTWERREDDDAADWLTAIAGDGPWQVRAVIRMILGTSKPYSGQICARLERRRNVHGETSITRDALGEIVGDVLRDMGRILPPTASGRRVMTIPRAKNREFSNVLVLWPHSVAGDLEHQRRLLYNAITRARKRCSVVVFGQGRTNKAPFA